MSETIQQLREDVNTHGEVHAVLEEAGAGEYAGEEVEIRLGTTEFKTSRDILIINDGQTDHVVPMDRIVRWYKPMEFTHG